MNYTCRNCIYRQTKECMEDENDMMCRGFKLDRTTLPLYEQIALDELIEVMKGV